MKTLNLEIEILPSLHQVFDGWSLLPCPPPVFQRISSIEVFVLGDIDALNRLPAMPAWRGAGVMLWVMNGF